MNILCEIVIHFLLFVSMIFKDTTISPVVVLVYNTVILSIEASPLGLRDSLNLITIFFQPPYSFVACLASSRLCLFTYSHTATHSQRLCLVRCVNSYSTSHDNWCTVTLWSRIMTAQCEGMGEVGLARYEPALLPPCLSIRVLSYSNCQRATHSSRRAWQGKC